MSFSFCLKETMGTRLSYRRIALWRELLLDKKQLFVIVLALEGILFWTDLKTDPTFFIGPLYLIPIVLATWYMDRQYAYFFVVLSTGLRVWGLRQVFPNQTNFPYFYNILVTGSVYLAFAFLVVSNKRLLFSLERHVQRLRILNKKIARKNRLNATIRRAIPEDVEAIVSMIVASVQGGAFSADLLEENRQKGLALGLAEGIVKGRAGRQLWEGGTAEVRTESWVSVINGRCAGYLQVMELSDKEPLSMEIASLVVADEYRGLGIGTLLTNFFCQQYRDRRLIIACKPDTLMLKMAQDRRFTARAANSEYCILEKRRPPKEPLQKAISRGMAHHL